MKSRLLILMLAIAQLWAAPSGTIKGKITAAVDGKAIKDVKVWITDTDRGAQTNSKGIYIIKNVPAGTYTLTSEKTGYTSLRSKKIKVRPNKTTTLNLKLKPKKGSVSDGRTSSKKQVDPSKSIAIAGDKNLVKNNPGSSSKDGVEQNMKKPDSPGVAGSPETTESLDDETVESVSGAVEFEEMEMATPEESHSPGPSMGRESSTTSPETRPGADTKSPKKKPAVLKFLMDRSDDLLDDIKSDKAPAAPPASRTRPIPQSGGLKAGFADDNKQFNYFLNFLSKYDNSVMAYHYDISERIHLTFEDFNGKSLPNLEVKVFDQNALKLLDQGVTFADGSFFIYPAEIADQDKTFQINYSLDGLFSTIQVDRNGPRKIRIKAESTRPNLNEIPVDIVFILDTTGSMGEEIRRLLATIDTIHLNLTSLPNLPSVRFGMVLYRDKDDEYSTKIIQPTTDIEKFRRSLEKVEADGGGDTPEDLQAALEQTLLGIQWNTEGLRLGFVITDAPPHLDYGQDYTYIRAATEAKKQGIKLFTVGTGGLNIQGEYVLRQIAQLTYAKYLFLTYGNETGENQGGRAGSVSHHTGSNYQTDKLEAIIVRLAKEEISNFTDQALEQGEDYFQADKVDYESREETLSKLFRDAIEQMVDFSTIKIENAPKLGVLPIHSKTGLSSLSAEYFSEQLQLSVAQNKQFTLIARKDLQQILDEQKLQLSGLLSDTETTQLGQLLGAELLLNGELYEKDQGYDLFLKLLRVETAEILAVTKIVLDKDLGL